MPTHGFSGDKPKRMQDHLGGDVRLESEIAENDPWAHKMLRDVGTSMCPADANYMGSMAVHYYKTDGDLLRTEYSIFIKNQFALGDMNESIAMMGVSNLALEMRKRYGRAHKTTDPKDRR